MKVSNIKTYGLSQNIAFECLCNQLFKSFLNRKLGESLLKFRVINGAGGDGGIEAYGLSKNGSIYGVQAKWFLQPLSTNELSQIRKSIETAISIREKIVDYIICIPHNVSSKKRTKSSQKGNSVKHEEYRVELFEREIKAEFPKLNIIWWFEENILFEIQKPENEGVRKYWFEKEVISHCYLVEKFNIQQHGWLKSKYIPHLTKEGEIFNEYDQLVNGQESRRRKVEFLQKNIDELKEGIELIKTFQLVSEKNILFKRLSKIKKNFNDFINAFELIKTEIIAASEAFNVPKVLEIDLWKTKSDLEELSPTNIQLNIRTELIKSLDRIHKSDIENYLKSFRIQEKSKKLLISGGPGTGKTAGLSKVTDFHLRGGSPAIIIKAKGANVKSWDTLLSESLNLPNWSSNQILSALESTAVCNDHLRVSESGGEQSFEDSKIVISIDGIEEDVSKLRDWIDRINETKAICKINKRLRFIFSARSSFYVHNTNSIEFEDDILRLRGNDVNVNDVAPHYFKEYNIEVLSLEQIKGLDNLLSLKLFCEKYKDTNLIDTQNLVTASKELLKEKLSRINDEFLNHSFVFGKLLLHKTPVLDSLNIICLKLFDLNRVSEEKLKELILLGADYLNQNELDLLIESFLEHGILYSEKELNENAIIEQYQSYFSICYQSIIDLILSLKVVKDIVNGAIDFIPKKYNKPIPLSPIEQFDIAYKVNYGSNLNTEIVKNITLNVFNETGKLVGEKGFLIKGFSPSQISELQMYSLVNGLKVRVENYHTQISTRMAKSPISLNNVFKTLILPSIKKRDAYFGAEFLHNFLQSFPNPFERDKLWSGLDSHEFYSLRQNLRNEYESSNIKSTLFPLDFENTLTSYDTIRRDYKFNELPLILAWTLSSIDMDLRKNSSNSLAIWGKGNVRELILLFEKMANCNDPFILEGLANVIHNIAGHIDDKEEIKLLAIWAIKNIYERTPLPNYNLVIKAGFQTVVLKAYHLELIAKEDFIKSKPMKGGRPIELLQLDEEYLDNEELEPYPVVHDLAWYVFPKSFEGFLEYPTQVGEKTIDIGSVEALLFYDLYRKKYEYEELYTGSIIMAIMLSYIKGLGFNRLEGNLTTEETHGRKSIKFTKEEKYIWIAVNHIRGYLSEYLPYKQNNEYKFIESYQQIINVDNFGFSLYILEDSLSYFKTKGKKWEIRETLSPELIRGLDIKKEIDRLVEERPKISFEKWIEVSHLTIDQERRTNCYALFNNTNLENSSNSILTSINVRACLIVKPELDSLVNFFSRKDNSFIDNFNLQSLNSYPTEIEDSNVFDLTWMSWVKDHEDGITIEFSPRKVEKFYFTITQSKDYNSGEVVMMPSKFLRDGLSISKVNTKLEFIDSEGAFVALNNSMSALDGSINHQEILMVSSEMLNHFLIEKSLEVVWFVTHIIGTNPHNKTLKGSSAQKVRKYLVFRNGKDFNYTMFWEGRFSNVRDS